MDALEVSGAAQSFSSKDKLRPNTVCTRLRLRARVTTQLPAGVVVHRGESTVLVPTKDLSKVLAQVWDSLEAERIDAAKEDFEIELSRELARYMQEDLARVRSVYEETKGMTRAQVEELYQDDARNLQIWTARERRYKTTGLSWEGRFFHRHNRGVLPIESYKIVEEEVQPSELHEQQRADVTLSQQLLGELMSGVESRHKSELEALRREIAELKGVKKRG